MGAISDYIRKLVAEEIEKAFNAEQTSTPEPDVSRETSIEQVKAEPDVSRETSIEQVSTPEPDLDDLSGILDKADDKLIDKLGEAIYRAKAKDVNLNDTSVEQKDAFASLLGLV